MLKQRKMLGLISAKWQEPALTGKVISVIIISNPKYKSSAYQKLAEVIEFCNKEGSLDLFRDLRILSFTEAAGLGKLNLPRVGL